MVFTVSTASMGTYWVRPSGRSHEMVVDPSQFLPQIEVMARARFNARLIPLAICLSLWAQLVSNPEAAHASILSGCVAPEDAGVTHVVGWVDVGVMLGMAEPEPPHSMRVTAPDGSELDYRDGVGLTPPTDSLPIWFAPAVLDGPYEITINGEEHCTIILGDGHASTAPVAEGLDLDWEPHSAPVHRD
jgi:hypothetical protein